MVNLIKGTISVILYPVALILGMLIGLFRELKETGVLDSMEPVNISSGIKDGANFSKEIGNEIKQTSNETTTKEGN
jgi:hypothetical protein